MKKPRRVKWILSLGCMVVLTACAAPPRVALHDATFAEPPCVLKRDDNFYLHYRVALENTMECRWTLWAKKTDDKAYYYFGAATSFPEWGQVVERPLAYDQFSSFAEQDAVYWLNPDGSGVKLKIIDEGAGALAEAAATEFGDSGYTCSDTVAVAKQHNVNYEQLVTECLQRNRSSMHAFFRLSKYAGFDGASHQGHAAVSGILLRRLGDDFFGGCLSDEPADIISRVRRDLLYDLGWDAEVVTVQELKESWPKTFPKEYTEDGIDPS